MNADLEKLKNRILTRGPNGELLSLLSGNESEKEIRNLIFQYVQAFQHQHQCPAGQSHAECPFRVMAGLSHASLKDLVKTMPLDDCVKLFEMELQCRAHHFNHHSLWPE